MNHERFKEWLHLSVFGELSEGERRSFDDHIRSCDECRRELGEVTGMLQAIAAAGAGEPPEELLLDARRDLLAALWKTGPAGFRQEKERFIDRLVGQRVFSGRWLRGYRAALAGLATLAIGFFAGYLAFGLSEPIQPTQIQRMAGNGRYTDVRHIRFLDADATDGEVELVYDRVRPTRLKAPINDERVQRLLTHALLNDRNPGVRLKAVHAFGAYEAAEAVPPPPDVKKALLAALASDPNPGVRLYALHVLRRVPFDDDIKRELLFVMANDENSGLRIAAMNALAEATIEGSITEEEMYEILKTGVAPRRKGSGRGPTGTFIEEVE